MLLALTSTTMKTLAPTLAIVCLSLGGCFGSCSSGPPDPEADCVDLAAPSESPAIVIGSTEEGDFAELREGATLTLDYGPQGGQHFYYALRLHGATESHTVNVSFIPDGSEPFGGGSADGGAGAGGSALGGQGGAGGGDQGGRGGAGAGDCCYAEGGNELLFLSEYGADFSCESGWIEVRDLFLQVNGGSPSGVLRVEVGTCAQGCAPNEQGFYELSTVVAAREIALSYRAP